MTQVMCVVVSTCTHIVVLPGFISPSQEDRVKVFRQGPASASGNSQHPGFSPLYSQFTLGGMQGKLNKFRNLTPGKQDSLAQALMGGFGSGVHI